MASKKQLTLKILLFLILTDALETFIQFCFKKSAISVDLLEIHSALDALAFVRAIVHSPFLWVALISVFCLFTIWSTILSKIDLSVAVPVCSFSYVFIPVVSMIFLGERISAIRWSGIFFILVGVVLVSFSTKQKKTI
ncbi:MAG: EamA family transporter [Candidatus Omnitrophica bacterium]|nr:EamA family transporter [Candidatus Omnitrophota bacterium]